MSEIKLNPEAKAMWVAALRSGKYKQGKGQLKDSTGGLCCLGVAQDVFGAPGSIRMYADAGVCTTDVFSRLGIPVTNLMGELGACMDVPSVTINGRYHSLYVHNDTGASFEQIADAIENQL